MRGQDDEADQISNATFGYADFETRRLNNDASGFQIGSISKTFTAIAVLQLKEKGKIRLDDIYLKYLPVFP